MKFRQPLLRSMTLEKSIIIAFDLETTGTNTSTDQIVQIAYGYYEKGELKDTVTKLFKPTIAINPGCLLYTSPSPRDVEESRMPSSA